MFPDYKRYGVMWMARKPLASAYDMSGAFNNVSLTLTQGANEQDVIDRLDDILKDYGGIGAYARKDQLSNRFLSEELKQQKTIATIFPIIFFGVAAFLLNVVVSRLISLQREQIAGLKAFGYSDFDVGLHYTKLVLMIVSLGIVIGIVAGIKMGQGMSNIYMTLYSLPFMTYVLKPQVIVTAALISMSVAVLGTLYAVRSNRHRQCALNHRPSITPPWWRSWPATLVLPTLTHDPETHRAAAFKVPAHHPGDQHGLRHYDDRWLSRGGDQPHGGGAVRYEPHRRPHRDLYRAHLGTLALLAAKPAGGGACRGVSLCTGEPALRAPQLSHSSLWHPSPWRADATARCQPDNHRCA
ncbi:ABC transporter permease [Solemya velum gill symbiont]|uniref:ABC transporter permease n=1 Tax=Solemya velum gill symbiont TaxID=2340 RepID=UPI00277B4AE5|nr:ABC transporter permease [Solemya velum gill symbiont]